MSMLSRFAAMGSAIAAPAAPISYVGGAAVTSAGSSANYSLSLTGLSGGSNTSVSAGDLIIVVTGIGSTALAQRDVGVVTTGYTEAITDLWSDDTYEATMAVSYKIADGTETSVTVLGTGSTTRFGGVAVHVWRNVDPVIPFDVSPTTVTGTNTQYANAPATTPLTAGAVIVACGLGNSNNTTPFTAPSGMTNDVGCAATGSGGGAKISIASYSGWTSGSYNPPAWTDGGFSSDSTNSSWCAATLVLHPKLNEKQITTIAESSSQGSSGLTLTISKPPGTRDGDLMVALLESPATTVTWTGDTGWTEVADKGSSPGTRIAYKVASSEGSSYTFTASASSTPSGSIITYRGAEYDAVGAAFATGSTITPTGPTASVWGGKLLAIAGRAGASQTYTESSGLMQKVAEDGDATSPCYSIFQQNIPGGATGTRSFVNSGGSSTLSGGIMMTLKPAAYTPYAAFVASNSAGSGSASGSVTLNTPACVPDNLLLLVLSSNNSGGTNVTFAAPPGWKQLISNSTGTTPYAVGMHIFYRIADGTEPSSYTITIATGAVSAAILSLSGVDPSTLKAGTTNTGNNTGSITANAITADANNSVVLFFGAQGNNNLGVPSFTPPSGMTEIVDQSYNGTGSDIGMVVAYQEAVTAGSTGDKTATSNITFGTSTCFRSVLVSVAPY